MKASSIKKPAIALLLAAVLVWTAGGVKNMVVRGMIRRHLEAETGLSVRLDKLDYKPFSTELEIRGLTLMNPSEFGDSEAIVFDRVYLDTGLKELLSGEGGRITRCEMDVAMLRIVSSPRGSNLDAIADLVEQQDDMENQLEHGDADGKIILDTASAPDSDASQAATRVDDEINIDSLQLTIGELVVQSGGGAEREKRYRVDQTLEFEQVDDLDDIAPQIMMTMLMQTGTGLLEDISAAMKDQPEKGKRGGGEFEPAKNIGAELNNLFK